MALTNEQLDQWCTALRSKELAQIRGQLCATRYDEVNDHGLAVLGYCCLGVLGEKVLSMPRVSLMGQTYIGNVILKKGSYTERPLSANQEQYFGWLNDSQECNFIEIALIVENVPKEEWHRRFNWRHPDLVLD